MKNTILTLLFLFMGVAATAQNVKDVQFVRNGKEVTITYNLEKAGDIRVRVSADEGRHYGEWLQNLSGDAGKNIKPGKGKTIIAYDLPDLWEVDSTQDSLIRFEVALDDGSVEISVNRDVIIVLMPIEGGTFTMGCTNPSGAKHSYENELPTHKVTVSDFYMGKFEVTQALWKAVMGENPSRWQYSDMLPVEQVSWDNVQIFIARLSQMTGYRFRLPTEAEWEFAARGGVKSKGYVYSGCGGDLGAYAWYGMNSGNITHPVGEKLPNELGLYDMSGNVWEWCSDWMGDYSKESQENPRGPKHGENRVLRGGSMNSPSWGCRVSDRSSYLPDYGYGFHGFRLVLDDVNPDDE